MYIILKQDFPGLGQKDAIVQVKPGYGRNYLIPKGFAVVANASNRKVALENKRQIAYKVSKNREAAEAIVAQLDQIIITIPTKVIENSKKIFGSITATQIADILQTQTYYHRS
jgi:large subunit ribosomal protein L9